MLEKFSMQIDTKGDHLTVLCSGALNEDAFVQLRILEESTARHITFNFRNLNYINSSGVRDWVLFVRKIAQTGVKISFAECSPTIVTQINMVPSMAAGAEVESVLVPFVCSKCQTTQMRVFTKDAFPSSNRDVKSVPCPKCASETQMIDHVDEYFEFANRS